MDADELQREKHALIERWGPWTASNIHLGGGVYTIVPSAAPHARMLRFCQVITDLCGRPLSALRILDLACHEGEYAVEFARQGAEVLGIEGRRANLEKAEFARKALQLRNLSLEQADIRHISAQKYGTFDAVLCSGILYHLDRPDVVAFLESIGSLCKRCVVVDTHISLWAKESFNYRGQEYWGSRYIEHHSGSSPQEREQSRWASLDNAESFWLTRPSLYNALGAAGFSSVFEVHCPPVAGVGVDRITLAAMKGRAYADATLQRWPEREALPLAYYARRTARSLAMRLPQPLVRVLRRWFGHSG